MNEEIVEMRVPFQVLADFVAGLDLQDKQRLFAWLEQQIAQAEEASWEQDAAMQAEIQEDSIGDLAGDRLSLNTVTSERIHLNITWQSHNHIPIIIWTLAFFVLPEESCQLFSVKLAACFQR